jgi:peptide/nickel transport system substrate-binding protein
MSIDDGDSNASMATRSDGRPIIDRRTVLKSLSVGGMAALAGCGDGGDGGDGDPDGGGDTPQPLGERVPTVSFRYYAGMGGLTQVLQTIAQVTKESIEDPLGLTVDARPMEISQAVEHIINDTREVNYIGAVFVNEPQRLDPNHFLSLSGAIENAGKGGLNLYNYADCEFMDNFTAFRNSPDIDGRTQYAKDAWARMANQYVSNTVISSNMLGAMRTDMVNPGGVGTAGVAFINPIVYIKTTPREDNPVITHADPSIVSSKNLMAINQGQAHSIWSHLIHSTLVEYDENLEMQNMLAETVETKNEGKTIHVELKDATFHNGDPITAEDVKFTFEHIMGNLETYTTVQAKPFESIEVLDDKAVDFHYETPSLSWITSSFNRWGILHKDTWIEGGAPDDPAGFDFDPPIGSGPFKVREFSVNNLLDLEGHDGHPVHSPSHRLLFSVNRGMQTALQAFEQNEIHVLPGLTIGQIKRIEDNLSDVAETFFEPGFMPYCWLTQMTFAPQQFPEFRIAISEAINRQRINEVAFDGQAEVARYGLPVMPRAPYFPDENAMEPIVSSAEGSADRALSVLEDAGWGLDDQGNLRYPEGKDLNPPWPAGERPSGDAFPCMSSDGQYIPPSER